MPRFSDTGADMYLCQVCGRDMCSETYPSSWRPDITGNAGAGNACPVCVQMHDNPLLDLRTYCHQESGGLTGRALTKYINRYYGHG
jgi:hypothetical protein